MRKNMLQIKSGRGGWIHIGFVPSGVDGTRHPMLRVGDVSTLPRARNPRVELRRQ
jgi:hypothetical protein